MQPELVGFDVTAFLRDTWQRRPQLIRRAWTNWRNPLDPDELAGLAGEAEVESRLVVGGAGDWALEHGPFAAARFGQLGDQPWTLLVQAVDHHVPDVAALIAPFRFLPNWRIDDVMVSYASAGGGVGPHFDQYDVFLVQGQGKRKWRIGGRCDERSPLLSHDDLRLLAGFEAEQEWVLEPGDVLYLPPGVAHDGIAVGNDCMTYSVGFRAPSRGELIGLWADAVLAGLDEDDRYADPELRAQDNPGEISAEALAKLQDLIAEKLLDQKGFARWFGGYVSTPKYPEIDWSPDQTVTVPALKAALAAGAVLERNPASRFAYIDGESGAVSMFVDGECHDCSGLAATFAKLVCAADQVVLDSTLVGDAPVLRLISQLCNRGSLAIADD